MIPRTETTWQGESLQSWQEQLKNAITEPEKLIQALGLDSKYLHAAQMASRQFPLRVPLAFLKRMQTGTLNDPLLRQVMPIEDELIAREGYSSDPLQEQNNSQPGLIQKYRGRVLLMVNGHCAINCRYCFRRHFPYEDNKLSRQQWQQALDTLAQDSSISEVIYSGGDPLASNDRQLLWLTQQIAQIAHIKRLRIHSRLPVVIPDRITEECLAWLNTPKLKTVFVLHINHAQEIDTAVVQAIDKLKAQGITLLNQSVLLKGVNDSSAALIELSERLFDIGVLPYYLHLLDKVQGAEHFDIAESQAHQLYRDIQAQLPGYLLPKLVREEAGYHAKSLVTPGG